MDNKLKQNTVETIAYVNKKATLKLIKISCALLGLLSILLLLKLSKIASEWLSVYVSRPLSRLVGGFSSSLPISIFEILFVLMIVYLGFVVTACVVAMFKKRFPRCKTIVLKAVLTTLIVVTVYTLFAGFGYSRMPLPGHLFYQGKDLGSEQNLKIADYYYNRLEYLSNKVERDLEGNVVLQYDFYQLGRKINAEYNKINDKYFGKMDVGVKKFISSPIVSMMGIGGVSFAPTAEANINAQMLPLDLVDTMAHEIAHSRGIMRENEADIMSFYVLLNSGDEVLEYIALANYISYFNEILLAITNEEEYSTYFNKFDFVALNKEKRNTYTFWTERQSLLGDITSFFNNLYLKFSGVSSGTGSYGQDDGIIFHPEDNKGGEISGAYVEIVYNEIQKILIKNFFDI